MHASDSAFARCYAKRAFNVYTFIIKTYSEWLNNSKLTRLPSVTKVLFDAILSHLAEYLSSGFLRGEPLICVLILFIRQKNSRHCRDGKSIIYRYFPAVENKAGTRIPQIDNETVSNHGRRGWSEDDTRVCRCVLIARNGAFARVTHTSGGIRARWGCMN